MSKDPSSWFYSLNDLLDANPILKEHGNKNGVVLAADWGKKAPYVKRFRYFQNFDDAVSCIYETNRQRIGCPSLYEYIGVANSNQKIWFDIDVGQNECIDPYAIVDSLVAFLVKTLKNIPVAKDAIIQVYETSYYDFENPLGEPSKYSFHVVVNGVAFSSSEKMKAFGFKTKDGKEIPLELGQFIDPIWTEKRQMRLLGSSKKGKNFGKMLSYHVRMCDGKIVESNGAETIEDIRNSMITEPNQVCLDEYF